MKDVFCFYLSARCHIKNQAEAAFAHQEGFRLKKRILKVNKNAPFICFLASSLFYNSLFYLMNPFKIGDLNINGGREEKHVTLLCLCGCVFPLGGAGDLVPGSSSMIGRLFKQPAPADLCWVVFRPCCW